MVGEAQKRKGADGSRVYRTMRGLGLPVIHDKVEHQLRFEVYMSPACAGYIHAKERASFLFILVLLKVL